MPAAVAVPAIVGGATSLASGLIGAHGAKSAAKTQSQAADRALAANQQVYNDQRQLMQPYVQGGQSAFQQLLSGWQHKQPGGMPSGAPAPSQGGGSPMSGGLAAAMPMQGQPQGPPPGMPQGGQTGGMVMMEGPDGSRRAIPQASVQMAMQRGARVVS